MWILQLQGKKLALSYLISCHLLIAGFKIADLFRVGRIYGYKHYSTFETIILEKHGTLSGTLKPEHR